MRTLVVGMPLPHVTFDNYSFASAPSFDEYERMIINTEAVSSVVEEIVSGSGQHRTFDGQPVSNGPSSANAFGLAELLAMRRRDAERLLARNGVIVCIAYPDVGHEEVARREGWRRYSWLPAPDGFLWEQHLLPGFGGAGSQLSEDGPSFAAYVSDFGPRLAYRSTVDEEAPGFADYARVFIRSPGGAAIGVELRLPKGHVILLPPLARGDVDRTSLAQTFFGCLEQWCSRQGELNTGASAVNGG